MSGISRVRRYGKQASTLVDSVDFISEVSQLRMMTRRVYDQATQHMLPCLDSRPVCLVGSRRETGAINHDWNCPVLTCRAHAWCIFGVIL